MMKAKRKQPPSPDEQWAASWRQLARDHPEWAARLDDEDAAYRLPLDVIDSLSRPPRPVLTPAEARAERAFTAMCADHGPDTLGAWRGRPVEYDLFRLVEEERAAEQRDPMRTQSQRLHYAGYLSFTAAYREDVGRLRVQWARVQQTNLTRALGPWMRLGVYGTRGADIADPVVGYYWGFEYFLCKWQLSWLYSWDLPVPMLPKINMPIICLSAVVGLEGNIDYYPTYFHVRKGVADAQVKRTQNETAKAWQATMEGYVPDTGRGGQQSIYHRAFPMFLTEISVRRRYGARRGLVSRLIESFEAGNPDPRYARRLRQKYRRCLGDAVAC